MGSFAGAMVHCFGLGGVGFRPFVFDVECVFRVSFGCLGGAFFAGGEGPCDAMRLISLSDFSFFAIVVTFRCGAIDLVRCVDFGHGGGWNLDGRSANVRRTREDSRECVGPSRGYSGGGDTFSGAMG